MAARMKLAPALIVALWLGGCATGQPPQAATLTDAQAADMLAGKWYINVHTAANPGGEIRGQLIIK